MHITERAFRCQAFIDRLVPDHDVLLFDHPGQGESTSTGAPLTMPQLAGILHRLADHLALPALHVVGVSWGGFVALEFARLFQERLHTLTLSGILLSHETLFEMYEALSLRFYLEQPDVFWPALSLTSARPTSWGCPLTNDLPDFCNRRDTTTLVCII